MFNVFFVGLPPCLLAIRVVAFPSSQFDEQFVIREALTIVREKIHPGNWTRAR
jgi:hypothetical protein